MKKLLTLWVLCALAATAFAQDEVTFSADRPGMATGVDVLPFKSVQWETGFQYDYSNGAHAIALPTTMFRFGISKFAELRVQYDGALENVSLEKDRDGVMVHEEAWEYSVLPLTIGTKVRIYDGQTENEKLKWLPATSLMVNLAIPSTPKLAEEMHVAPSAYLLFHHDATDWLTVDYNLGIEWYGIAPQPHTFLALCLGFSITDQWGAFLESYNYITDYGKGINGRANLDFGFTCMVHPRVQLDVYGGFNCQDPKSLGFAGLGVAWSLSPVTK